MLVCWCPWQPQEPISLTFMGYVWTCCSVMALPPGQLGDVAQGQGLGVAVFDKGRLPLRPGMSEEELGAMFATFFSS